MYITMHLENKMTTAQRTDADIVLGSLPSIGMGRGFQGKLKDEVMALENDCLAIRQVANEIKNIITIEYDPSDKDYGDPEPLIDLCDIWRELE
jgi:hypothetical protein